jgi:hypothetical protein
MERKGARKSFRTGNPALRPGVFAFLSSSLCGDGPRFGTVCYHADVSPDSKPSKKNALPPPVMLTASKSTEPDVARSLG